MRWLISSMVVALVCAGCDAADGEGRGSEPLDTPPGDQPAAAPTQQLIEHQVRWPQQSPDRDTLAVLSPAAAAAVPSSAVPVLVPRRHDLLASAVLITRPRWSALSLSGDGLTVSLHATSTARRYPHIDAQQGNRSLRGHDGFVGQNRGIWSASWRENGVAYALDVECSSLPDPRCEDDSTLLSLVSELTYVGGRGAEEVQP